MTKLPALLEMISTLIRTPSVSSVSPTHDMSNRPIAQMIANWLADIGAQSELMELPGTRDNVNVVGQIGNGPPGLALCGHTDTVPYNESLWQHDPFGANVVDGHLYGLGAADMKGFLALAIHAVHQIDPRKLKRSILFIGSADEESSMDGARFLSADNVTMPAVCLVGEPTNMQPISQHKGTMMERVTVTGRSGHSSDPSLGLNAIEGMQEVMLALKRFCAELSEKHRNDTFDIPTPTLNFGRIQGGDNPNRICGQSELDFDLRLVPGMQVNSVRAQLHKYVRASMQNSDFEISFTTLFAGANPLRARERSAFVHVCEKHAGQTAGVVNFCTEAPFYTALGADTIVMGPGSIDVAHQPNECLPLAALEPMQEIVNKLIHHYCVDV